MLQRCQPGGYHQKRNPSYIGVTVCQEWIEFQDFAEWVTIQPGFHEGYELDKDAIDPGNKIYCPDKCVFLPKEVNSLLITNKAGEFGVGVYQSSTNRFSAKLSAGQKKIHLGTFQTVAEAAEAYRTAKKKLVADAAEAWKDRLCNRGYQALLNWEPGRK